MNLHFHFSVAGFSNCYVAGPTSGGAAIVVDPGAINTKLIRTIEDNDYSIDTVLITHRHDSNVKGLGTLQKIYDFEVFAFANSVYGIPCKRIQDDIPFDRHGVTIHPIVVTGHSVDSVVYRIGSMLFTGDVLGPGRIGSTPNAYARALEIDAIEKRLFVLPGDCLIFPAHGAPSTLDAERRLNPAFSHR